MDNANRNVLIADEDPLLVDIITFRLELAGYTVTPATSASDTLRELATDTKCLLIVGDLLDDTDGLELLNRVSNDIQLADVPRLYISVKSDLDDVQKAFNAGASDYLVVPFDPHVLETKVEGLVEQRQLAS